MLRRCAIVVLIALAGCAASHSGASKTQLEYLKAHPLSADEERRLYAREAKRGDTLDRVRVTFDDCEFYRRSLEGELAIWGVHCPVDVRPIRFNLDKLEEAQPGGSALLTFRHDRLESAIVIE